MRSIIAALRTLVLPYGQTSGQRIVLDGVNGKIQIYDGSNRLVSEIDATGIEITGSNGTSIEMDPNGAYPSIQLWNSTHTNDARIELTSDPVNAFLRIQSGEFDPPGDFGPGVRWGIRMGDDFFLIERAVGADDRGPNISMFPTHGNLAYYDGTPFTDTKVQVQPEEVTINGRLKVTELKGSPDPSFHFVPSGAGTGLLLKLNDPASLTPALEVNRNADLAIGGAMSAGNIRVGGVSIVPVANVATSTTVTYPAFTGGATQYRGFTNARSAAPGTQVLGTSITTITPTSALVTVTRNNTTTTAVDWMVWKHA